MPNILLLEDNADMLTMISQVLEWAGHQVITGRNGMEGMTLLSETDEPLHLIICDLFMPGMDGAAFLKHVRNNANWSRIPFILMSANDSDEDRQEAYERGADGFLAKPFGLDDLNSLLESWNLPTDS
jgi:CheY-like chemotaxis protein